ncbi:hypothetical protein N9B47_00415 [bacterium]|nr:hypothetical protein [bacterium]
METTSEQIKAEARACDLRKLEQAKRMTPTERFLAGAELFEEACEITLAVLQMQKQLDDEYLERWCGKHGTLPLLAEARSAAVI